MPSRIERANAIRALALDAVDRANSGHAGAPMGMADIAEVLWREVLRHNPGNPGWWDRDRFVLSNGHASMLVYALLHLTGYALHTDDLQAFRQLHSRTPGHPEYRETPGVETTTGPLGQGFANAVGMAIAEQVLAARFNRPGLAIVDHRTWVFMGDGCMMEGISHEAASLAGNLGLGKLIAVYDDNGISIDGKVAGWFTDDTAARFTAYGWRVVRDIDGQDGDAVQRAIAQVLAEPVDRPTLLMCRTTIGFGAPTKGGTSGAHGTLGHDETLKARANLGWQYPPFEIPQALSDEWSCVARGANLERDWSALFDRYGAAHPELAATYGRCMRGDLPADFETTWQTLLDGALANTAATESRKASGNCLDVLGAALPELIGGSADLSGSNNTKFQGARVLTAATRDADYINYGVREFGMTAIANGLALHGGLIPYTGTFLTFLDYARNAVRLAALMGIRNILVYTHDSIAVGEDGPTHQPVEHIASLRSTPKLSTWRPADAVETAYSWRAALLRRQGPTALVLSRQKLPALPRTAAQVEAIARGGYVLYESVAQGGGELRLILIATGSEVQLAMAAAQVVAGEGHGVRVVSMPSVDVFDAQDESYRAAVLPANVRKRVAIEAAHPDGWYRFVGLDGLVLGVRSFGLSAPGEAAMAQFGFTPAAVIDAVRSYLHRA